MLIDNRGTDSSPHTPADIVLCHSLGCQFWAEKLLEIWVEDWRRTSVQQIAVQSSLQHSHFLQENGSLLYGEQQEFWEISRPYLVADSSTLLPA